MARNPKDLVVAYYQFHRSLRTMSYRGTFQEFCRRFMNDKRECVSPHGRPARPVLVLRPQPLHAGLLPRFQAGSLGLRGDGELVRGHRSHTAGQTFRSEALLSHVLLGS